MIGARERTRTHARHPHPEPFSPRSVRDLLGWWEAAEVTEFAAGSTVASWRDRSGNGRDATQPVVTRRPTLVAEVVNGFPALRFDGVDDALVGHTGLTANGASTGFLVARLEAPAPSGRIVSLGALAAGAELGIGADTRGTQLTLHTGGAFGSPTDERRAAVSLQAWRVISWVYAPGVPFELRQEGSARLALTNSASTTPWNPSGSAGDVPFAFGAAVGGARGASGVLLAAVLLYGRALNDTERGAIERRLVARYGLAGS